MVCEGCLSVDRKLTVADQEVLKIYLSFLDTEYRNNFVQLCWECGALFKRLLRFKQQVKCAHTVLVRYLIPQPKSLSTLRTTECNNIIDINHETLALPTFVKVEDDCMEDGSGPLSDDYMEFNVEELEMKTDIKCDPILEAPEPNKNSGTCDAFNESDEEPLRPRERDRTNPRGRRKHKHEGDRSNDDF